MHENFRAEADITRCLDGIEEEDGGEVVHFAFDLRVRCEDCGESFGFRGVPCGVNVNGPPMRSADALTLRGWLLSPSELVLLEGPAGLVAP